MQQRLDFYKASPSAMRPLIALEAEISKLGIDPVLLDLVKLRASQINGCAYCVDLHATDLRKKGESERKVFAVAVWRETPFFSDRERAALAWTEALTLLPQSQAPDAEYDVFSRYFNDREKVDLTLSIGLINVWNRLAVGFRKSPIA
jgi:AhpD family alkylhydroperoxidase